MSTLPYSIVVLCTVLYTYNATLIKIKRHHAAHHSLLPQRCDHRNPLPRAPRKQHHACTRTHAHHVLATNSQRAALALLQTCATCNRRYEQATCVLFGPTKCFYSTVFVLSCLFPTYYCRTTIKLPTSILIKYTNYRTGNTVCTVNSLIDQLPDQISIIFNQLLRIH